ncbi:hypothetical protein B0H66DRAFT_600447 [Apodospora peruviana]|uniref:Uncharacterized protein n=1 Tax=Apodospora peruviana TaxID=516989 RepID=A0AAE0IK12_9PEZI|nr:hypothetical protein B0H66DRAFT_600447 [Apodospora peruviana]
MAGGFGDLQSGTKVGVIVLIVALSLCFLFGVCAIGCRVVQVSRRRNRPPAVVNAEDGLGGNTATPSMELNDHSRRSSGQQQHGVTATEEQKPPVVES